MRRIGVGLVSALVTLVLLTFCLSVGFIAPRARADLAPCPSPLRVIGRDKAIVAMPMARQPQESSCRATSTARGTPSLPCLLRQPVAISASNVAKPCYILLPLNHPQHAPPVV